MNRNYLHIIIGSLISAALTLASPVEAQNGRRPFVGAPNTSTATSRSNNNNSVSTGSRPSSSSFGGSSTSGRRPSMGNGATIGNGSSARPTIGNGASAGSSEGRSTGFGNMGGSRPGSNSGIGNGASSSGNGGRNTGYGNNGNHYGNSGSGIGNGARPGGNSGNGGGWNNNNGYNNNNNGNYQGSRPNSGANHWPNNGYGNNGNHYGNGGYYGGNRPGYSYGGGYRPGEPASASRPGFHGGRPSSWYNYVTPPMRRYRPYGRPLPRLVPPPSYRPYYGAPIISGILGLTFGSLYNNTLDYLYDRDYTIDGYTENTVYLRNVRQLIYNWPDVILNYDYGRLVSAQFIYSTPYYSMSRYNHVYEDLCDNYGSPISGNDSGYNGYQVMWYGGSREGIVSLEFYRDGGRYYTILSYGNN